jgi:hypothetical protein
MKGLWSYLAHLSAGRLVLWNYFIWYLYILFRYFDPSPRLWLTSLGLSVIIGFALLVNTTRSGRVRVALEPWPVFRLFVTPFCVSSFSALVVGHRFILIFPSRMRELAMGLGLCALFCIVAAIARFTWRLKRSGRRVR